MILDFLLKILGNPNERKIKKIQTIVDYINNFEPEISVLSDEELRAKTVEFRNKLDQREMSSNPTIDYKLEQEALENILPEAFAVVREAGKRTLNMRHFDVQLIGGYILHKGQISEMRTGEGKTLVATLPAYLNALTGKGVHIVTVNDYLAKRDSEWMGHIYKFLGLDVGLILSNTFDFDAKRRAYATDITYGTNNEFGFDYLRDNMAGSKEQLVQRPYNFAIVDEVDSILIDEARTPLIISGRLEKSAQIYKKMAQLAPKLKKDVDYTVEEKNKNIILEEEGIDKAIEFLKVDDLYDPKMQYAHYLLQALKAKELFNKDTDYVIKDDEIVIVDEFTGRLMPGRRWSDGLHQSIEAKEGVKIQDETQTLASITFQNLFRLYPKLAGMTGTAMTEEAEFGKIYNLEVTTIPTNRNDVRKDLPDIVYKTEKQKFLAVVNDVEENHKNSRPVLVGTISIDKSEHLSALLKQKGIKHNVLNAKHHEKEAQIIAQAGRAGAVTIATNMAGRGTDIILGGNYEFLTKEILDKKGITHESENYEEEKKKALEKAFKITKEEHEKVKEAGGLYVIGTERHESRRIDNQLRGRAGRQGDPGATRFYLSLEDNLMRIFGGQKIAMLMNTLNIEEDTAIESALVTRSILSAQKKVETYHFDIRKQVLEYDDVMNKQRELFYSQRKKVLEGENIFEDISYMIEKEVERMISSYISPEMAPADMTEEMLEGLLHSFKSTFPSLSDLELKEIQGLKYNTIYEKLKDLAKDAYLEHEKETVDAFNNLMKNSEDFKSQQVGDVDNVMRNVERDVLLRVADSKWIDHLHNIDILREGIGLRAYGQKDPLIEYKREAFDLFNQMMSDIQKETVMLIFRTQVVFETADFDEVIDTDLEKAMEKSIKPVKTKKVNPNDPCSCGSGLKYKKCCGKDKK